MQINSKKLIACQLFGRQAGNVIELHLLPAGADCGSISWRARERAALKVSSRIENGWSRGLSRAEKMTGGSEGSSQDMRKV